MVSWKEAADMKLEVCNAARVNPEASGRTLPERHRAPVRDSSPCASKLVLVAELARCDNLTSLEIL